MVLMTILKPNVKTLPPAISWQLKAKGKEDLKSQAIKFDSV